MARSLKIPQNQQRQSKLKRKEDFKETIDITNECMMPEVHKANIGNIHITQKHPRIKEWK